MLRETNPDASLTEAQRAVAADYGFASWPRLKAHVEQLGAPPEPSIFPRLTPKARGSLFFSWHEANRLRSGIVEPGHLLLALMRVSAGLKAQVFPESAMTFERARAAADEADARHHRGVAVAHLLIGVLREGDAPASTPICRKRRAERAPPGRG